MNAWRFYLAGAGGGALTAILDFSKDWNNGTVARMASVLGQHLLSGVNLYLSASFWAIILIVTVSLFICWVFQVTSQIEGFLRGCAVVTAFALGSPNPIINFQPSTLPNPPNQALSVGSTQQAVFPVIVSSALAQNHSTGNVGEAFIRLEHLRELKPVPESTVTVRDDDSLRIVSLFKIKGDTIRIAQPYGNYLVEVATPGFSVIDFELTINQPISGSRVSSQQSAVPIFIQKLVSATKVDAAVDEAEKHKQLGRQQRFSGNWDAAITEYETSLKLDPNDAMTHDYLGYAYFRQGKLDDAVKEFDAAIKLNPDYPWSYINLIKVDCAQQKYDEARRQLKSLRGRTDVWETDVEFERICKPILG
jgi:hypothetical protein